MARLFAVAGMMTIMGMGAGAQTPATLTDLGTTAPTPGAGDISQLSTSKQQDKPDGLNYYTDNQSNHGAGEPGQTFTTGNAANGYQLNSLAIKTGGGTTSGTGTSQNYLLHIYSVSGSTATLLATYSASSFAFADGDWLRWSGFSLSLTSNVSYAYSFGKASSAVAGYEAMGNAGTNLYTGGQLGIFPVAGGIITFGSNTVYDAVFDAGLTTNGPVVVATITNSPATAIQATTATLNGNVISTGGNTPQISIYYGTSDGGTNAAAWSNSVAVGAQSGIFSAAVTGLKTNTTYFFTAKATNSAGISWAAPSINFSTLATVSLPAVTNLPVTGVQGNAATLNGQIISTGGQTPNVTLFYGPTDGGTNAGAWSNSIALGLQNGNFSYMATGLTTNTAYYYSVLATNLAGPAWAAPSLIFTTAPVVTLASVLTYHNDNARTGANTNETLLTPANVNTNSFGRLFTNNVDGYIFAQPLYVPNLPIPGQGTHNVVIVATEHDSVYAFDADGNGGVNGGLLWHTNLGVSAFTSQTASQNSLGGRYWSGGYVDLTPEVGITGTPVIDPTTGTIYVDVFTREVVAGVSTNYYHRIHALNLTNGMEQPYGPMVVTGTYPGTNNMDSSGGVVTFNAHQHAARPALTLAGGKLYAAYGSYADTDPYHGWIMGFNATNLAPLTNYVFNTTPNAISNAANPNACEGAIWMGGGGLCVDANTNLYFEVATGTFDANTGNNYGDSFVKLSTSNKLAVADYFTPFNQASLASADTDLGSGGPMLLPDTVGSTNHPHLMVGGGKDANIFLLDRDNLGGYNSANNSQIVQEFSYGSGTSGFFSTPAYFNYHIYYQARGGVMKTFAITNGQITTTPASISATSFAGWGVTPSISANGSSGAIAWAIQTDGSSPSDAAAGVLHAYNATNLALELYNSNQNAARDKSGGGVKYTVPMVANGKVYVGSQYTLAVYGLTAFVATPIISPNGASFTNSQLVTITEATPGAAIYYTLDGSVPTTNSLVYTGPIVITTTLNLAALAVKAGAANSGVAVASFVNTAAAGNGVGLLGQYWTNTSAASFTNNGFATLPTLTRTDTVVNFNWSNGPAASIGTSNYTVRWTGSVQAQYNESYTFGTIADDGVRLWVNGQLLVNDWNTHTSPATNSGTISLNAQQLYTVRLEYFQSTSNAVAQLQWSSPSTAQAIIPQTQLYPYTNPPPVVILSSPSGGATNYTAAASVTLAADTDAPYNPVSAVSFYANGGLLGTLSNNIYGPFHAVLTATGLAAGNYALTAVATDGSGLSNTSAPVNITVNPASGQPYGLTANAPVAAFLNMPTTSFGALPPLLSGTGAFGNTTNRTAANGLIPYTPNTPLWSDAAVKSRFMAVPNNGGQITPDEQIQFRPTNSWTFPAGTVFVKNFDLVVNETNPSVPLRRLETRLLVRDINGAVYGVTYKRRADNSDADLLSGSLTENILITNATGVRTQAWYYPSPQDCLTCHTPVANYVLGLNTRQLNGNQTYPATGNTDNQLRTLNRLGLFNPAFDEAGITNLEKLSALTNLNASLEERARSYLDANCAQCHQPGGAGITFDARYDTPLISQKITNYPAAVSLGLDNACIVKAKDIWRSVIYARMNSVDPATKMPPLARSLVDTNALQVFNDWINSLPGTPALTPPIITPNGGTYGPNVSVTLTPPDGSAQLYYTLNGTLPGTNSLLYTGPVLLTNSATLTANAFETNYNNSIGVSAAFTVQAAAYFTGSSFLPGGQFQLGLAGVPGKTYVLQASTNLTDWTPLSTNLATTNTFNLSDPGAATFPKRFYRTIEQ